MQVKGKERGGEVEQWETINSTYFAWNASL